MVLNQHHRDVVAFLRIGDADKRFAVRPKTYGLIVQNPISDIIEAFFGKNVRGVPGLGEPRPEPTSRRTSGVIANGVTRPDDVFALVRHLLHVLLREAVA